MQVGGIEKSIISLLNTIDYSKVDVDLLLLRKRGDFLSYIPKEVRIIDAGFCGDFSISLKSYLKNKFSFKWKCRRIFYAVIQKLQKYHILGSGVNITYMASLIKRTDAHYDAAVAYVDWTFDYLIHYVCADRKYAYIHVNYDDSIHEPKKDKKLFEKCDAVYTVSEDSKQVLIERFPTCKEKIKVWNNVVDEKMHLDMAANGTGFEDDFDGFQILTVGRAAYEKGLDIAIKACSLLKERGYHFRWYYIGTGELVEQLKSMACQYNVEDDFIFMGSKANPYRCFAECDLYVQCSRYEGYGLTLAEAAIFCKPRVVTDLEVFKEQVEQMKTGIMVKLDEKEFADNVAKLIDDKNLYEQMVTNLKEKNLDNAESLKVFYNL